MDKFIIDNINILSLENKQTVAKILLFKDIDLQQSNNGAYCFIDKIDERTKNI